MKTVVKYQLRDSNCNEVLTEGDSPFEVIINYCVDYEESYSVLTHSDMVIVRVDRVIHELNGNLARVTDTIRNPRKVTDYTEVFELIRYVGE